MLRASIVALALVAALCWAAGRPLEAWSGDLGPALGRGQSVVVLVAAPDRPQSLATRDALEQAWRALRPRARRVPLERCDPRLGRPSALALLVLSAGGELVARR